MEPKDFGKRGLLPDCQNSSQKILAKLRQNFSPNNIPFHTLTFGTLFGLIKNEGIEICNELKLQAKYGSEKA